MNRYQVSFQAAKKSGRVALLPYYTAGYPTLDASAELIKRADSAGVVGIELGLPYSDSIADGPVIQSSFHRVLQQGFQLEDAFEMIERIRSDVSCAITVMTSYTLVHRYGLERFMGCASDAGIDGVILPDVPLEESQTPRRFAIDKGLCYIGLIASSTRPDRCVAITRDSTGFIYKIAVAGVTGERKSLPVGLAEEVERLRDMSGLPVCVGFGVGTAGQVGEVCKMADGAIVGSAIVRRITDGLDGSLDTSAIVESVANFVEELLGHESP